MTANTDQQLIRAYAPDGSTQLITAAEAEQAIRAMVNASRTAAAASRPVDYSPEAVAVRAELAQERAEAAEDYVALAQDIAFGARPDSDTALAVVHAAGKSLDNLAEDVAAIGAAMGRNQLAELFLQAKWADIFPE